MATVRSRLRKIIRALFYIAPVEKLLETILLIRNVYASAQRTHPIDRMYGIDTSGVVQAENIHPDQTLHAQIIAYVGSQPSIARRALSAALVATARVNAAAIARQFPDRPKVTIAEANVVHFPLPASRAVLFNYHAFGAELMAKIVARCEAALSSAELPHLFFIYYNPVHAEALDAPAFERFYLEQIPYDKSEIGFGPDQSDLVAIWHSVRGSVPAPHQGTGRSIIRIHAMGAGLANE